MKELKTAPAVLAWMATQLSKSDELFAVPQAAANLADRLTSGNLPTAALRLTDGDWSGVMWDGYLNEGCREDLPGPMAERLFYLAMRFMQADRPEALSEHEVFSIMLQGSHPLANLVTLYTSSGRGSLLELTKVNGAGFNVHFTIHLDNSVERASGPSPDRIT